MRRLAVADPALKMIQVRVRYPGCAQDALRGLDLVVEDGAFFCLLGPNGAGKTTAVGVIGTLISPSSGSVTILGKDLFSEEKEIKCRIGLVPQDIALYERLTPRENLAFFARLYGLKGEELRHRITEALAFVGLEEQGDRRLAACSGGMKRRANLAAGILNHPKLLILDEPTVGIDAQSRRLILDKLQELNSKGVTLLYTTHYMDEVERVCTHGAIIDEGRVILQGTREELLAEARKRGGTGLEDLFFHLTGRRIREQGP